MSFGSPKGSEWRKCDLHIHTPASLCSEYGGQTNEIWEKFFLELEELSQTVKIVGINDYLFLDGYKKVLEYKKSGGLKNIELLLPVIEFRLKEFVGHEHLRRINYHIIFANEEILSHQIIESQFLSGFNGKAKLDESSPQKVSWGGVVTRDSLINLGKQIYEETPEKDKHKLARGPIDIGFDNINFEISKIEDLLGESGNPNSFLKGNYYKAIGKAEWEEFRWTGSPSEKRSTINSADFVFTASKTVEQANKGLESLKLNEVNHRLLHCSDAHAFAKTKDCTEPKELGHCFTWIKANSTFEGLREAITEYGLRVRIQDTNPNQKIPYEVIQELRFITDDSSNKQEFTPKPIMLNPDLNTIIGGKSCGKSLLIYNIANTVDPLQVYLKESEQNVDEKVNERKKDKYGFSKRSIDFEVTWANGVKQKLSQNHLQGKTNYSILYIPQSYIQKIADTEGRRTRKEVGKIIREILLQKDEYKKYYQDFIEEVKRLDINRETLISNYIIADGLFEENKINIQSIGDKNAVNEYIIQLQNEVKSLKGKSNVTVEDQNKHDEINLSLKNLATEQFEINNDKSEIEAFKYSFDKLLQDLQLRKRRILQELKNKDIQKELLQILSPVDELQKISEKIDKDVLGQAGLIINNEVKLSADVHKLKEDLQPLSERFFNKEEIEKREQQISVENTKLDKIKLYEEILIAKKTQKEEIKQTLLTEYRSTHQQYINIINKLNQRGNVISSDLNLRGSIKFYTKRFYERLRETINNKSSASFIEDTFLFQERSDINDVPDAIVLDNIIQKINQLFDLIMSGKISLKGAYSKKDALNALFRDEFFDYWEILSGKDEIANMSPGKAGLVLLKLLIDLSNSKCPILIDQPEDNLDNRSIYTDLVQYIRDNKSHRQFIVVTHNPNIVVGADAENVIVANQNDQDPTRVNSLYQFDYTSGALEYTSRKEENNNDILSCMGIREHVSEILEGGKEAFQKREAKYRYNI